MSEVKTGSGLGSDLFSAGIKMVAGLRSRLVQGWDQDWCRAEVKTG